MHPEKHQKTESDDTSENGPIATSTEGNLLLISQIYYSTTVFRLELKKIFLNYFMFIVNLTNR